MKNYCILHEVNQWAGPARCPVSICVASSQMIWRTPYSRRFLTRPDSNDPERSSRSPIASLPDRDRIQASSRASQLRASASARRSLSPTRHVRSLGPGPAMLRSGASVWATGTSEWPLSCVKFFEQDEPRLSGSGGALNESNIDGVDEHRTDIGRKVGVDLRRQSRHPAVAAQFAAQFVELRRELLIVGAQSTDDFPTLPESLNRQGPRKGLRRVR
jgi:hypothetical protein